MHVVAHWAQRAIPYTESLGFTSAFIGVDLPGEWLESPLGGLLNFFPASEAQLRNEGGAWEHLVEATVGRLRDYGMLEALIGVQFADEFYSHLWANSPQMFPRHRWPSLAHAGSGNRAIINGAVGLIGQRLGDIRRIFGASLPPMGIGMAEAGGVDVANAPHQDWWGLNFYLGRPGWYLTRPEVEARYHAAASKGLPLMPVVPLFADQGQPPARLADLEACYLPLLETYRARTSAVGVFCLNHPSTYAPGHVTGQGIAQLDPAYETAAKALTSLIRSW